MTVLDASAILALIHNEPGADFVAERLESGTLCTANLAEVIGKLVDAGVDARLQAACANAATGCRPIWAPSRRRRMSACHMTQIRYVIRADLGQFSRDTGSSRRAYGLLGAPAASR